MKKTYFVIKIPNGYLSANFKCTDTLEMAYVYELLEEAESVANSVCGEVVQL